MTFTKQDIEAIRDEPDLQKRIAVALGYLREMGNGVGDEEINHSFADDILLAVINDGEISAAFEAIKKWYA